MSQSNGGVAPSRYGPGKCLSWALRRSIQPPNPDRWCLSRIDRTSVSKVFDRKATAAPRSCVSLSRAKRAACRTPFTARRGWRMVFLSSLSVVVDLSLDSSILLSPCPKKRPSAVVPDAD